jgi:hypothetical protein
VIPGVGLEHLKGFEDGLLDLGVAQGQIVGEEEDARKEEKDFAFPAKQDPGALLPGGDPVRFLRFDFQARSLFRCMIHAEISSLCRNYIPNLPSWAVISVSLNSPARIQSRLPWASKNNRAGAWVTPYFLI